MFLKSYFRFVDLCQVILQERSPQAKRIASDRGTVYK